MLKADCDIRMAKNSNFSKRRNIDLHLNVHSGQKQSFVFCVEGAYSVWNNHDEILLKNFLCTILLRLQFSTGHKFAVFSDRHQLSELSFQWFDPIKIIVSVQRLENFVPALPLHLSVEPSPDLAKVLSSIFNLSLAQTI